MRFLYKIFMIVLLVILLIICCASGASAAHESSPDHPQPQLPFCDEDNAEQIDRNAG